MSGRSPHAHRAPRRPLTPLDELRTLSWRERLVVFAGAVAAVLGGWAIVALGLVVDRRAGTGRRWVETSGNLEDDGRTPHAGDGLWAAAR